MHQTILRHIRGILSGYAVHIFLVLDDLGGLDLNITQGEMNQINKYKKDVDGISIEIGRASCRERV